MLKKKHLPIIFLTERKTISHYILPILQTHFFLLTSNLSIKGRNPPFAFYLSIALFDGRSIPKKLPSFLYLPYIHPKTFEVVYPARTK
jgi:hypothetical protein